MLSVKTICKAILSKAIPRAPRFLISWYWTPDRIKKNIAISLRTKNPITIKIDTEIPEIGFCLEIINSCPFDIEFDRMVFGFFVGHFLCDKLLNGYILNCHTIKRNSKLDTVCFERELTYHQQDFIRSKVVGLILNCPININYSAYFYAGINGARRIHVTGSLSKQDIVMSD